MTQDIFLIQDVQKRLAPCKFCGKPPEFKIMEETTPRSEPYVVPYITCWGCHIRVTGRYVDIINDLRPPELIESVNRIVEIWNDGNRKKNTVLNEQQRKDGV